MTIKEYEKLLKQFRKEKELYKTGQPNNFESIQQQVHDAEQDDIISNYISIKTRLTRTKKLIGCWTFYKKDTTKLIEKQRALEEQLAGIMHTNIIPSMDQRMQSPVDQQQTQQHYLDEITQILRNIESKLDKPNINEDHTYYIINLAWSKEDGFIINTVRDFLDMSSHIHTSKEEEDSRNETMMTWKYYYDTLEEQSIVKSLLTAADHLLNVLKSRYPGQTDAEVFGKIQKF